MSSFLQDRQKWRHLDRVLSAYLYLTFSHHLLKWKYAILPAINYNESSLYNQLNFIAGIRCSLAWEGEGQTNCYCRLQHKPIWIKALMGPYCLTIIDHFWQHTSCQANPTKKIDYLVQVRLMCNSKWGRTRSLKKYSYRL